jgi:hypothetical protein
LRPLRWPCVFSLLFTPSWCGQRRSGQVGSQDSASARTSVFLFMRTCGIAAPPSARFLFTISCGSFLFQASAPLTQPIMPSSQIRRTSASPAYLPRQSGAPRAVVSTQTRQQPLRSLEQRIPAPTFLHYRPPPFKIGGCVPAVICLACSQRSGSRFAGHGPVLVAPNIALRHRDKDRPWRSARTLLPNAGNRRATPMVMHLELADHAPIAHEPASMSSVGGLIQHSCPRPYPLRSRQLKPTDHLTAPQLAAVRKSALRFLVRVSVRALP